MRFLHINGQHQKRPSRLHAERRRFRAPLFVGILVLLGILFSLRGIEKVDYLPADSIFALSSTVLSENPEADARAEEHTYILNANTKKFHDPDCFSIRHMSESNKVRFVGQREEVLEMGYSPCGHCCP